MMDKKKTGKGRQILMFLLNYTIIFLSFFFLRLSDPMDNLLIQLLSFWGVSYFCFQLKIRDFKKFGVFYFKLGSLMIISNLLATSTAYYFTFIKTQISFPSLLIVFGLANAGYLAVFYVIDLYAFRKISEKIK